MPAQLVAGASFALALNRLLTHHAQNQRPVLIRWKRTLTLSSSTSFQAGSPMPKALRESTNAPSNALPPACTVIGTVIVNTLPLIVSAPVASKRPAATGLITVERNVAVGNLALSNQAG